jgi:DNA-binding transcriptional MerR regulator
MSGDIAIPDRPAFKASEVCEIAKLQPYVLRLWENEFPDLGVARTPGGPRVYRRTDVERVLRIRHLVFHDGLTLAGVRRRLDGETPTLPKVTPDESALFHEVIGADLRLRLNHLKSGLRSLLELVSHDPVSSLKPAMPMGDFHLEAPSAEDSSASTAQASAKRAPSRRKTLEHR